MVALNVTRDGQQKAFEDLICSLELTPRLHTQLIFISVLNSIFSVTAFLGNALILIALPKESSLHPPSKLFHRNLATTDLCVGLVSEPITVIYRMSQVNKQWNISRYAVIAQLITNYTLCGVSIGTLTAISVDRLLALLLGLRYRQVVTLKRAYVLVITMWILCTVVSAMRFWNRLLVLWCGIIVTSLCLVISTFSYSKMFFIVRQHQNQIQDNVQQPNQTNRLNIARYKKAVSTAIWLQMTLVACYLPSCVVAASRPSSTRPSAWIYKGTLILLNSSLDPILYCCKIEEVRQAVKGTIRQMLSHCFASYIL